MFHNCSKLGLLLGGALIGTVGVRILQSREMRTVYTHATAAVLREKERMMKGVTQFREECGDIYADAKALNEERAAKEEIADKAKK